MSKTFLKLNLKSMAFARLLTCNTACKQGVSNIRHIFEAIQWNKDQPWVMYSVSTEISQLLVSWICEVQVVGNWCTNYMYIQADSPGWFLLCWTYPFILHNKHFCLIAVFYFGCTKQLIVNILFSSYMYK